MASSYNVVSYSDICPLCTFCMSPPRVGLLVTYLKKWHGIEVLLHNINYHTHIFTAASQMWLLARLLPIMIGSRVTEDSECWANFVLLLDIADLLLAPESSEDEASLLSAMISDHHKEFVRLYPAASVTPKFHYLVHMPRLITE